MGERYMVPWSTIFPVKDHGSRRRLLTMERVREDLIQSCVSDAPIHFVAAEARLTYAANAVALMRGLARAPPPVHLYTAMKAAYPPLKLGPLQTKEWLETNQVRIELLFAATALTVGLVQQAPGPEVTPKALPLLRHAIAVLHALREVVEEGWFDRGELRGQPECLTDPATVARHLSALHLAFDAHLLSTPALRATPPAERLGVWVQLNRYTDWVRDYPWLTKWVLRGLYEVLLESEGAWQARTLGAKWQAKEWLLRRLNRASEADQCVKELESQHTLAWDKPGAPPCLQPYFGSQVAGLYSSELLEFEALSPAHAVQIGMP